MENYFINRDFFKRYRSTTSELLRKSTLENDVFSIVIPTYGRFELLKKAINSCLTQSFKDPFEIVIVDNDPTRGNGTEQLIESIDDPRITYYKNSENIGCIGNFNRCIELTSSKYLIMLHTDDLLDSSFLERIVPLIQNNRDIDILIPGKRIIRNGKTEKQRGYNSLGKLPGLRNKGVRLSEKDFSLYNIAGGPIGIVMKKDACIELGGFDERVFPMSDYAFWVRAAMNCKVVNVPITLGSYRFLDNISSETGMQLSYIRNEYDLMSHLIEGMRFEKAFRYYLPEYVRYRLRRAKAFNSTEFTKVTGHPYRWNLFSRLVYYAVIISMVFSYAGRAMKSDMTI